MDYKPKTGKIAHQKLKGEYKRIAATIYDAHKRGAFIREMLDASRTFELHRRKKVKEEE